MITVCLLSSYQCSWMDLVVRVQAIDLFNNTVYFVDEKLLHEDVTAALQCVCQGMDLVWVQTINFKCTSLCRTNIWLEHFP